MLFFKSLVLQISALILTGNIVFHSSLISIDYPIFYLISLVLQYRKAETPQVFLPFKIFVT